ncbi:DNA replication/repair protein RecF [Pullulanibacillus sp. KACC 23026]|uniref:DNA replication/repair protein RecF n=1 Tax=Pullulanibacillus sp. KACC 23026 TaxID=3028315 RepID=UPI0023B15946|nr:DNA replication/repair protein RecF [Pullulanibacillus sp. KACC 23026]WEG12780.1 DNA replication/repair protein RecF [Pullulanibacillus sp. KACC 23026]
MFLESIHVKQFRNYKEASLSFSKSVNVFLGENAQGKTNLLEAIYVLAMARSHRTPHDKELIQWDKEYAKIEGRIQKRTGSLPLEITLSSKGKKAKANHIEQRKLSQYVGICNVVMFAPEDLTLVKGSPGNRRRFIDIELGQIQPIYLYHLSLYQKILQQRNALLKDMGRHPSAQKTPMLDVLTDQLIQLASEIIFRRFRFIRLLRDWAGPIHKSISRGLENLFISYECSIPNVLEDMDMSRIKEECEKAFGSMRHKELDRGITLIGPHRDDLLFKVNEKNVQTFGSQGQQRTTALSLKLAEIELIYSEVGEYPLLLLDDVLSELDDYRQTHLLGTFQEKVQTFVTTTSVGGIAQEMISQADSYIIHSGHIEGGD